MLIKLAIADDHCGIREMMADGLERHGLFNVVVQADNGIQLLELLRTSQTPIDICVLDLNMPQLNGFDTLLHIRKTYRQMKVLVYSQFLSDYNVQRIYKYGANGAFSKELGQDDLVEALQMVYTDGLYIPPGLNPQLARAIRKHEISLHTLSPRETEFIQLCAEDLNYKEIAARMAINLKTVDRYRENICLKFNLKSRAGIIMFAMKAGVLEWSH